jgi:hypothetical protein
MKPETREKMLKEISSRFQFSKNKHLLELKSNEGLHYLTSSLTLNDDTSKEKFINLIDRYIEEFKNENKYKLDLLKTNPNIRAVKKLKKLMKQNFGTLLIYKRKVAEPGINIKEKYLENIIAFKKPSIMNLYNTMSLVRTNNTFKNTDRKSSSSMMNFVHDDLSFSNYKL